MSEQRRLRIGFIPLCRRGGADRRRRQGLCRRRGLDVELVREVSWSNMRDKLNIGLFDAAHLIAPIAIASSLGLGHVKVPIVAPFDLGVNGNAITVSPRLYAALAAAADGDLSDPMVSARALARVVAERKAGAQEPLTFGMTFPFSHPQLSSALLDGGGRRRSGRGRAAGGAAAALHGRKPRQQARRRLLRRRAVEFGRGRSRHRPHPAFRLRDPGARRRRRCWRCASAGRRTIPTSLAALIRALARAARIHRGRRQPRRGRERSRRSGSAFARELVLRTLDGR